MSFWRTPVGRNLRLDSLLSLPARSRSSRSPPLREAEYRLRYPVRAQDQEKSKAMAFDRKDSRVSRGIPVVRITDRVGRGK